MNNNWKMVLGTFIGECIILAIGFIIGFRNHNRVVPMEEVIIVMTLLFGALVINALYWLFGIRKEPCLEETPVGM